LTIQAFYRVVVWLPVALPGALALVQYAFGRSVYPQFVQPTVGFLFGSLVYAGIPYAALAAWATWRIGRLSEPEIKRLMVKAPFLMIGAFTAFWLLAGVRVGRPEFVLLGPLAAFLIVPVGYGYMGLVLLIREQLGDRLTE
jgi:hypothetical protein